MLHIIYIFDSIQGFFVSHVTIRFCHKRWIFKKTPFGRRVFRLESEMRDKFLIFGHAGQHLELTDQISSGEWTNMDTG